MWLPAPFGAGGAGDVDARGRVSRHLPRLAETDQLPQSTRWPELVATWAGGASGWLAAVPADGIVSTLPRAVAAVVAEPVDVDAVVRRGRSSILKSTVPPWSTLMSVAKPWSGGVAGAGHVPLGGGGARALVLRDDLGVSAHRGSAGERRV